MPNNPATNSPDAVVSAAFAAMNTEDWQAVAALCDPQGLRIFKNRTLEILEMLQSDCETPRDLSDIVGSNSYDPEPDFLSYLRLEVAGVSSVEEVREMESGKVFTRWIQAKSFRPRSGADDAADVDVKRQKRVWAYTYVVLGSVRDGDDIAHVVIRLPREEFMAPETTEDGVNLSPDLREYLTAVNHWGDPIFITCRLQPDASWRMIPRRNLFLFDSVASVDVTSTM